MTTRTAEETETLIAAGIVLRITPADAGCWLMGSVGWHNGYRVIDRACEYGFVVPAEYVSALDAYRNDTDNEDAHEAIMGQGGLSDMATDYLQSLAPAGYVFEWDMGELSLMREEDTEGYEG